MPRHRKTGALTLVTEAGHQPQAEVETPNTADGPAGQAPVEAAADVRALARKHGPQAIAALVKIVNEGASEASKIAAANALLDRAYGKARPGAALPREGEGGETKLTVMFV